MSVSVAHFSRKALSQNGVLLVYEKAAAICDARGRVGFHRIHEPLDHARIARVIAIGENDVLAIGHFDALVAYGNPSAILLTHHQLDPRIGLEPPEDLHAWVRRAVVYDDDLNIPVGLREEAFHSPLEKPGMVVTRNDDAHQARTHLAPHLRSPAVPDPPVPPSRSFSMSTCGVRK